MISIHALRVEGDVYMRLSSLCTAISIHALRVEGDAVKDNKTKRGDISIHALRVEGDSAEAAEKAAAQKISIHALRVEGDGRITAEANKRKVFLSTPSGWKATAVKDNKTKRGDISIHALRVEGDLICSCMTGIFSAFLSTPSGWKATKGGGWLSWVRFDFYPRPPGGRRLKKFFCKVLIFNFYPRPPGGRRLEAAKRCVCGDRISIHALRVEGDKHKDNADSQANPFLSTPSGWKATSSRIAGSTS